MPPMPCLGGRRTSKDLFFALHQSPSPMPRVPRGRGRAMNRFICTMVLMLLAAVPPTLAKTVRIPITRMNTVPVPCGEDPLRTCHNRWHPNIPAVASADPGDIVIFETRDAFD